MSDEAWERLERKRRRSPRVPVGNVYGCWYVPRLFLVFHSERLADRLREHAERYGWEEVKVRYSQQRRLEVVLAAD